MLLFIVLSCTGFAVINWLQQLGVLISVVFTYLDRWFLNVELALEKKASLRHFNLISLPEDFDLRVVFNDLTHPIVGHFVIFTILVDKRVEESKFMLQ